MKMCRLAILLPVLFALLLTPTFASPSAHATHAAQAKNVRVKIVTSEGNVTILLDQHAPKTVANFLRYVDRKFYDGGTFFRSVPGFVIQGGNHDRESPSDPKLELEPTTQTGILNKDGAISMARTPDPNSATSEFFLCDGDQTELDASATSPGYAAFGHVLSGMEIVRKIARLPAQNQQLLTPIRIVRIVRLPIGPEVSAQPHTH
jgi:peptidyl-prolyl cis-trans isomerase A (cyclophilin A)